MYDIIKMINKLIDKLTHKFTETIFYKKNSELEEQIKTLKLLLERYPNNEKLQKVSTNTFLEI